MQQSALTCSAAAGLPRPAAAATQRPRRVVLVAAQEKGFSGGGGQKLPKQVKKSKRGKVASRPSPKLTLEQLQQEQAAYEAAQRREQQQQQQQGSGGTAAAAAAAEADDGDFYAPGPSSSSSGGSGGRTVEYGSTAAVPEAVTNRMLQRVILFMGTPVFGGIMLFPFFYWLKVKQDVDLPNWVPYLASSLTFGGGLLGISYGIMSASWDPRREGSLLGWTEFQANVPLLMDRFKRK